MDLNLVRLVFTLQIEEDCADPYVLFGLKPSYLAAFRHAAGCKQPVCSQCTRARECTYHRIFSQFLSAEPAALKRYQKPSFPFVFDIPVLPPLPNAGHTVELGLTLAGIAVNHIDEQLAAILGMLADPWLLKRINVSLVMIESSGYGDTGSMVMEPESDIDTGRVMTLSLLGLKEMSVLPADAATVTILTPLRIISEGRPVKEFSFSVFIRALLRRVSSLVYYYGGEEDADLDFKWLAGQSLATETIAADFRWVEQGSRWSGLIGSGTFTGVLPDYHPFLLAGEYLHVGKGASFGMGAFHVNKTP
jgi:CRISPR-associated endoribonuclease Cas6